VVLFEIITRKDPWNGIPLLQVAVKVSSKQRDKIPENCPKLIKQLIEQNKSALEGLIREYNVDTICHVAKILLEGQIFESTLNAKIRFPEVFDVSPAQSADREMSEADAARDEANMVRDLTQKAENVSNLVKPSIQTSVGDKGKAKVDAVKNESKSHKLSIPSLYPIYITYRSQHHIMVTIQSIVEEGCYDFARDNFHKMLAENKWDCPEAVELTEWTQILSNNQRDLCVDVLQTARKQTSEVFQLLRELRHSAVHRLHITASKVEKLVENAQLFLDMLVDRDRSVKVSLIRRELRLAVEELERNKDLLEARLLAQLREIDVKRSQLKQLEQDVVKQMSDEDHECQNDVGSELERRVAQVQVTSVEQNPTSELKESESESEVESDAGKTVVEYGKA